jgi:hypothetical protein
MGNKTSAFCVLADKVLIKYGVFLASVLSIYNFYKEIPFNPAVKHFESYFLCKLLSEKLIDGVYKKMNSNGFAKKEKLSILWRFKSKLSII